jgi:hypothetical protein
MREVEYAGERGIELVERGVRMIAVHSIGPRIAWFGRTGTGSVLFWDDAGEHRRGDWRLHGGHRLWITRPLADETYETYEPDNEPCAVRRLADGVRITAPAGARGIEKTMVIHARGSAWTIEHRLRNTGELLWSGGAWALTCTLPRRDTVYRIPLGGGPAGWDVAAIAIPLRWGGTHRSRLDDPQFTFTADAMEIRARADEAKRMVLAPRGVIEMRDPARGVFRKHTRYEAGAIYPMGANLAVYLGPRRFMVEMESMSPLRTLAPGEALIHRETWLLGTDRRDPGGVSAARS